MRPSFLRQPNPSRQSLKVTRKTTKTTRITSTRITTTRTTPTRIEMLPAPLSKKQPSPTFFPSSPRERRRKVLLVLPDPDNSLPSRLFFILEVISHSLLFVPKLFK